MLEERQLLQHHLEKLAEQTGGKVYLQVFWKKEEMKTLFSDMRWEAEFLVCISAEEILSAQYDLIGQIKSDFALFSEWWCAKTHLVITGIDINKRYDHIFRFEGKLLRAGIRVWEHYATRLSTKNLHMLFSENGIGNNDHIPVGKKIAFVMDYVEGGASFGCCVSQLFCDGELGIGSSFAVLDLEENRVNESDFWDFLLNEYRTFSRMRKYLWSANNPIHNYSSAQDMMLC